MFEHPVATPVVGAIIPVSAQGMVIVVLAMVASLLLLLVIAMRRRMTLRVGKIVLAPHEPAPPEPEPTERHHRRHRRAARAPLPSPPPESTGDSSVHTLDELAQGAERAPEPTQPFDLAAVAEAVSATETMRAIEALRAVEARHHARGDSFPSPSVRSFKMAVCPLFVLYEVSGSSPRVHVIPSDMRDVEVGRSPECAIYSPNPSVSQRHFHILVTPGGSTSGPPAYLVELEDCGSRNGTWVNHKRIQGDERKKLKDGDIIEAASSRYLFYYVLRSE